MGNCLYGSYDRWLYSLLYTIITLCFTQPVHVFLWVIILVLYPGYPRRTTLLSDLSLIISIPIWFPSNDEKLYISSKDGMHYMDNLDLDPPTKTYPFGSTISGSAILSKLA